MEAAVIAIPNAKFAERPLAVVAPNPNAGKVTKEELLSFLGDKVPWPSVGGVCVCNVTADSKVVDA